MENLDPNQLPILPDPTEPTLPAPVPPISAPAPRTPWFRGKLARIVLISVGTVAVILLVLFGKQIGQLLNLFGTKAGNEQIIVLDSNNFIQEGISQKDKDGNISNFPDITLFKVPTDGPNAGKLMLNDQGQ